MSGNSRDEQLIALEAAVAKAESKLRSAEMTEEDIDNKIKNNEEDFQRKLQEKAIGYKEQTGADFVREVDSTGKVTYKFAQEADEKEQKKRRKLVIRRQFDSENGTHSFKAEFVTEPEDTVENITSAKDFKKPKGRKRFIAAKIMGHYGKIEFSTEVNNPFLNVIGKPVIVPVQAAVKLMDKVNSIAADAAQSPVGKKIKNAGKVISSPIVIPANIIKDIADKGGIIHSVVDLGDKIKIEGVSAPKPVKAIGAVTKGLAQGTETAVVQSVKGVNNFTIEVAKDKIYEEMNKSISENEATKAAFVIGMKTMEIYRILDEHTKFKRAVRRDKAGNDVTNTDVSKYLAYKAERKHGDKQERLREEKAIASLQVKNAREEYAEARRQLEIYRTGNVISSGCSPVSDSQNIPCEKISLSKIDKKILKTKGKLGIVRKHTYRFKIRRAVYTDRNGNAKFKLQPSIRRRYVREEQPATAWNTAKKLDGLAIGTATQSLRRKAMRDGSDNSGIEAGNFAITAIQQGNALAKKLYEKQRQQLEKGLEKKLEVLENQKKLPTESANNKPKPKDKNNRTKSSGSRSRAIQREAAKRRVQRNVYQNTVRTGKQAAKEIAKSAAKAVGSNPYSILVIIIPVLAVLIIMGGFLLLGMPMAESTVGQIISPCSINDIGLCDRYYTELGKNLIDKQQNIESYYPDYDKYVCLTDIDKISHSPEKLLPYAAVKTLSENGSDNWTYEEAKPYIEDVFNTEYEFYTNEIHETRKNVTTVVDTSEDEMYSFLGKSTYSHKRPTDDIPNPLTSDGYVGYANTYTHVEITVFDGYTENTLDSVGVFTDKDGNTTEYDEAQTVTFSNYWSISLVYDWFDEGYYLEYWVYKEERQEYFEFDYVTLEYAIKENNIDVDSSYYTDTDENWQDNNFDKLIYNRVSDFSDSEKEGFQNYLTFNMGHQELKLPFDNPEITKYPGYNNDINGDMALDYSIELRTYSGQEIICGMDGEITPVDDKSFSVYNAKYGTLYYDYVVVPTAPSTKKGDVISSSTGDTLRITFVDNEGNYLNPLFLFT